MTKENFLSKSEIKFVITIIGLVLSGATCFFNLKSRVNAVEERNAVLRKEYEISIVKIEKRLDILDSIKITQTEIKKDIEYIKKNLFFK